MEYEAWRAGGTPAAETLSGVFGHLAAGGEVPHDVNEAWLSILLKGTQEDDVGLGVQRAAAATRPLALNNVDTGDDGYIDAGQCHSLQAQWGFVPGRSLSWNAAELYAHARTMVAKAEPNDTDILLPFDVEVAFPSECRQFLRTGTRAVALPSGAVRVMEPLYACNTLWSRGESARSIVTPAPGVAQGCPLSGCRFPCWRRTGLSEPCTRRS